jgi:hypothetical protein
LATAGVFQSPPRLTFEFKDQHAQICFSNPAFDGGTCDRPAKARDAKPCFRHGPEASREVVLSSSEDEVNAFMHETFGFNPQMTWKVVDIKPAQAKGLAEVTVQISGPEGQGGQRFFVTEDGKHALVGDIIPFGKRPLMPRWPSSRGRPMDRLAVRRMRQFC